MELAERIAKMSPEQRKLLELKLKQQGMGGLQPPGRKKSIYRTLKPVEKKEYYVLSSAQKRFFMLQQLDMRGMVFNMFHMMLIEGKLVKRQLEEAIEKLINRHESLRTCIDMLDEEPRQKVLSQTEFNLEYFETNREEEIDRIIHDFPRPFDLKKPPLLRLGLIKLTEEKYYLLFDMHHIISDATSVNLLVKSLIAFYAGKQLPPLKIQYKDFCEWQNRLLMTGEIKKQEEYWLNYLAGDLPVLNMPTDYPRPAFQNFEGGSIDFQWDPEFTRQLKKLGLESGATLFMVLLALYSILLSKYTRQKDIIIGLPIAGRNHTNLEHVIGLFIETLVLRIRFGEEKTFSEFLEEVKKDTLNAFENQAYPFRELLMKVADESDFSRNPLFDAMLILQKRDTGLEKFQVGEINVTPYEQAAPIEAKVDINLDVKDREDTLFFTLEYCSMLFKRETMERFIVFFREIAAAVANNKEIKLIDIKISHDLLTAVSGVYKRADSEFEF
ncbi:MAG: hypothetical protein QG657_3349 [Acidobacteriota bacterium]|nr:hypothetical protein [Acidobacteriota bacterium]